MKNQYTFVPSIGISQLIEVPKIFQEMAKQLSNHIIEKKIIFRVTFDKKFSRVISMEQNKNIGKRIVDIPYNKNGKFFTFSARRW